MGACCTKDASFAAITAQEMEQCETEFHCEEVHDVTHGEYGASIRLNGFSTFVSMSTQQGKKGINQDAMTVWEDFLGEKGMIFCGVFDGHGPSGHRISRCVRDNIPCKIGTLYKSFLDGVHSSSSGDDDNDEDDVKNSMSSSWKHSIIRSFKEMDEELCTTMSTDAYCSGATGVTVIKQDDNLIIGNLGDSRAILCTRGDKGQPVPVQLTVDLKPNVASEAERIRSCNGRVFGLEEEPEILRVWEPDQDCPGLAMTRAFGDFCLKDCGVISTPQLFHRKLTEKDDFVVLATDGIWDALTNLEVVEIISSARKRSMAAKLLITYATQAWKSRFPSSRTDDMAVVCLFLKQPETNLSTPSIRRDAGSLAHIKYYSISSRLSNLSDLNDGVSAGSFGSGRAKDDLDNDTPRSTGTVALRATSLKRRRW